jgi:hypothetical protein
VSLHRNIRECQRYADACGRIAARAADAKTHDDFLRLQHSWLRLGGSLAFAARLSNVRHSPPRQLNSTEMSSAFALEFIVQTSANNVGLQIDGAIAALGEGQEFECAAPRGRGELALSCAPSSVPRRHVTDAWYTGTLSENNKRKLSGMLPASTT